jgi:hypothetical protein
MAGARPACGCDHRCLLSQGRELPYPFAHQAQKKHWAALLSSQCDDDYAAGVRRVGVRHREINLSLAWYVAGYAAIKIEFVNVIVHCDHPVATKGHLIRTLEKYVALDTALALSVHDMALVD